MSSQGNTEQAPPASAPPAASTPASSTKQKGKGQKKADDKGKAPPASADKVPATSIPVAAPKSQPSKSSSPVQSSAVAITGWGTPDESRLKAMEPRKLLLEHCPDAFGYFDLVDAVYTTLYSSKSSEAAQLPRSLFRYYCGMFWWYRVLWVNKSNGYPLSSDDKEFISVIEALPDLSIPDKIAQYLANMGNFQYNGETFRMRLKPYDFSHVHYANGWLPGFTPRTIDDTAEHHRNFWAYATVPVPGVLLASIINEFRRADHTQPWDGVPIHPHLFNEDDTDSWRDTQNIVGFDVFGLVPYHKTWYPTLHNLGFRRNSLPTDMQTQYQLSPSCLALVARKLTSIGCKVFASKQIGLSNQGFFGQIAFLSDTNTGVALPTIPAAATAHEYSISMKNTFRLAARSLIPGTMVTPLFCFGYKVRRSHTNYGNHQVTMYSPFFHYKRALATEQWLFADQGRFPLARNATLNVMDDDLLTTRYESITDTREVILATAVPRSV